MSAWVASLLVGSQGSSVGVKFRGVCIMGWISGEFGIDKGDADLVGKREGDLVLIAKFRALQHRSYKDSKELRGDAGGHTHPSKKMQLSAMLKSRHAAACILPRFMKGKSCVLL